MRSSMLPTGLVLFLLLCFAGCGGGDSTEVADAEGAGDGSTESTPADGGSDSAQMYGGGETRGEGSGSSSDSSGDASMEMYGGSDTRGEYGDEDSGDEEASAEMYGGSDTRGDYDDDDSGDEEDYGEMYGSGDDSGGSGRPGPMRGNEGGGPQKAAQPKTFADMANQAYGQGREAEAFQFLFAHAVTADDQSARALLAKMGWITPLKRPGLGVRWGIGVEFNNKGYNGNDLYPIGTTQQMQNRNPTGFGQGRRDDGGGGFGGPEAMGGMESGFGAGMQGGGMQGGSGSSGQLEKFTGEVGQKVVDGLRERVERGDFGVVLKEAGSAGPGNQGPGGMMGQGQYGQYDSGAEMGDDEGSGGYEDGGPGGMGGGGGNPGGGGPSQLVPGVTLVGLAPAKDLVKVAEQAGVDVLCVFNVAVTQIRRTGQVSNNVEIQLYNVADGKKTFTGGRLNNLAVQAERAKDTPSRGGDSVDKEIEKLFKEIDTNWRLASLPALQPDHVLVRIGDLLKESHQNPLPVLAEIRMYHTRGLLQDNHLLLAYQRKTNDQSGTMLATGTEEERKQVIQPWLPTGR